MKKLFLTAGVMIFISCGSHNRSLEYFEKGKLFYNKKNFSLAMNYFVKSYKEDKSMKNALLMQSKIYYYKKEFNTALNFQNRILSDNKNNNNALYWKARTLSILQKNNREAIVCLKKILETDNYHLPARKLLALNYEKGKEYLKAIEEYKKIIKQREIISSSKKSLISLYKRLGLSDKIKEESLR